MFTKTFVGIAAILCSFAASAQTPSSFGQASKAPASPAQILERVKAAAPFSRCASVARQGDSSTTYSMADGSQYEFAYDETGKVMAVTAITPAGQRVTVEAVEASEVRGAVGQPVKNADPSMLRAELNQAMEKFLKAECARFERQDSAQAPADSADTVASDGAAGSSDLIHGPSGRPAWDYDNFIGYADFSVGAIFDSATQDFATYVSYLGAGGRGAVPKCTVLVKECTDFCSTIGQLEYTGCGALALTAGFSLGPPTGALVGFYCSGTVYAATEQCKTKCQVPTIVCSW